MWTMSGIESQKPAYRDFKGVWHCGDATGPRQPMWTPDLTLAVKGTLTVKEQEIVTWVGRAALNAKKGYHTSINLAMTFIAIFEDRIVATDGYRLHQVQTPAGLAPYAGHLMLPHLRKGIQLAIIGGAEGEPGSFPRGWRSISASYTPSDRHETMADIPHWVYTANIQAVEFAKGDRYARVDIRYLRDAMIGGGEAQVVSMLRACDPVAVTNTMGVAILMPLNLDRFVSKPNEDGITGLTTTDAPDNFKRGTVGTERWTLSSIYTTVF